MLLQFFKNKLSAFIWKSEVSNARKKGVHIGKNVSLQSEVILDPSFPWLITIGDDTTLASRVHILAHDASTFRHIGYTKVSAVLIGNKTFIGANTLILPGVHIGNNVVIGAGSVVTKSIPDNTIAVGNPAKIVGSTSDYIQRQEQLLKNTPEDLVFDSTWTVLGNITPENKDVMYDRLKSAKGFVV